MIGVIFHAVPKRILEDLIIKDNLTHSYSPGTHVDYPKHDKIKFREFFWGEL